MNNKIMKMATDAKTLFLVPLLIGLLSGCAGKTGSMEPVFFPPAPNDPHIQYLTGITDSADIEGKKVGFSLVLTGKEEAGVIKKIGKANGITAHKGKLYISSTGSAQVVIVDIASKKFDYLKGNNGRGKLQKPINTAVDDQGFIYVADTGRDEIVVYDPAGNYVTAYGKSFPNSKIVSVAAYGKNLYALDNRAGEIKVLNPKTGEQIGSIGRDDQDPLKRLALPIGLAIDSKGFVYVTNIGSGRVLKYDIDGNFVASLGRFGDTVGEFSRPRGIAVDDAAQIYVVDAGHQNVQVFNKETRLLGFFGNPGLPAGSLNLPSGIAVSKDNLAFFQQMAAPGFKLEAVVFVVNQYTSAINPSISVYGLGEMEGKSSAPRANQGPGEKK